MPQLALTEDTIIENLNQILADNRTSINRLLVLHKLSVRDRSYERELSDGRKAVLGIAESKSFLRSPEFNALFGDDVYLWLHRSVLVDFALKEDGTWEKLFESEEDNLESGDSHALHVEAGSYKTVIDLSMYDLDHTHHAENLFSYEDQKHALAEVDNMTALFSDGDKKYIFDTLGVKQN